MTLQHAVQSLDTVKRWFEGIQETRRSYPVPGVVLILWRAASQTKPSASPLIVVVHDVWVYPAKYANPRIHWLRSQTVTRTRLDESPSQDPCTTVRTQHNLLFLCNGPGPLRALHRPREPLYTQVQLPNSAKRKSSSSVATSSRPQKFLVRPIQRVRVHEHAAQESHRITAASVAGTGQGRAQSPSGGSKHHEWRRLHNSHFEWYRSSCFFCLLSLHTDFSSVVNRFDLVHLAVFLKERKGTKWKYLRRRLRYRQRRLPIQRVSIYVVLRHCRILQIMINISLYSNMIPFPEFWK